MSINKPIAFVTSLLLCLYPIEIVAQPKSSVLQTIENTGVVKFGIREDAPPFGYVDDRGNLKGYCLDLFALVRDKLIERLDRNVLAIQLLKSRINNRFALVKKGAIDLECGPNTIEPKRDDKIAFSTSFFVTGTQFLLESQNLKTFNLNGNLNNVLLGVIGDTTTETMIRTRYPQAIIERFAGTNPRSQGVKALRQGRIDAMVSDGILLRAEAQRQSLSRQRYLLIPEMPLTCDRYGLLLPGGDAEWKSFVDEVILSRKSRVLLRKWFAGAIPDLKIAEERCNESNQDR